MASLPDPRPRPQPSPIRRLTKSRLNCRIRRGDLRGYAPADCLPFNTRRNIATAFSTLTVLPAAELANLNELGYLSMTPVQAAALPAILAGKDVRVQAKTGSGKTAAFGLGLLQHIDPARFETQSLVLCPTRELADQVAGELRRLARCLPNIKILMLCGGQPFGAQRDSLSTPRISSSPPRAVCSIICRRERSPLTRCRPW